MNFISNILTPIDYSEASIDALNYSIKIVKKYHAKLTIVHVVSHFQKAGFHADFRKGVSNLQNELTAAKNQLDGFWRSIKREYFIPFFCWYFNQHLIDFFRGTKVDTFIRYFDFQLTQKH